MHSAIHDLANVGETISLHDHVLLIARAAATKLRRKMYPYIKERTNKSRRRKRVARGCSPLCYCAVLSLLLDRRGRSTAFSRGRSAVGIGTLTCWRLCSILHGHCFRFRSLARHGDSPACRAEPAELYALLQNYTRYLRIYCTHGRHMFVLITHSRGIRLTQSSTSHADRQGPGSRRRGLLA